ncbi:amino acid adenylation domain-containing protein [Actinoplanes sp. NPDC051859]|uniref:amino acid adenylation domain-containing protein n=1 Tax=Actinoplanes sp. NPDC051859 TaxID=3363909 RepID=UPI0037918A3C
MSTDDLLAHVTAQVRCRPDAVAGRDPAPLTYSRLDALSDDLAARLQACADRPAPIVGVHLDRGNRLLVALLAIVKVGGTYFPMNAELPRRRLAAMVDDAAPDVIVTAGASPFPDRPTVDLDDTSGPAPGTGPAGSAADFSYLLFTSGSTGGPKGVLSGQMGLLNRLEWMQQAFALSPADRVVQKTPFSFDVSLWELLWPLMYGATVVFARPGGHLDGRYLRDVIAAEAITIVHFVPSMLEAFLRTNPADARDPKLATIRLVVTSGEALSAATAREAMRRFPAAAELHNLYGPTEASIDATAHRVDAADLASGVVPIGRAITGMSTYVVDADGRPVAAGEPGELWLAGTGLAHGYHHRPELTARAFPTAPAHIPAARVYRTGDLVRDRGDGVLEFLGRIDRQVKFRGVRIELTEVEEALTDYPGVVRAHAVLTGSRGTDRLVAFVETEEDGHAPDAPLSRRPDLAAELRDHLAALLPAAAVPTHFAYVTSWPTTPHGKLDGRELVRRFDALPAGSASTPPETLTARVLTLFQEVLGTTEIAASDSFFDIGGGDSLTAVRLAGRLQDEVLRLFGVDISGDASIFIRPTARELADDIERRLVEGQRPGVV